MLVETLVSSTVAPGTAAFLRLVDRVVATGICDIEDLDQNPAKKIEELTREWVLTFDGTPKTVEVEEVRRCFEGKALVQVRATVAHDSYLVARLLEAAGVLLASSRKGSYSAVITIAGGNMVIPPPLLSSLFACDRIGSITRLRAA